MNEDVKKYIRENYGVMSDREIGVVFGMHRDAVQGIRSRMGLSKDTGVRSLLIKRAYSVGERKEVAEAVARRIAQQAGEVSDRVIANEFQLTVAHVGKVRRMLGMRKIRDRNGEWRVDKEGK